MSTYKQKSSLDVNDALTNSEAFIIKYKKLIITIAVIIVIIIAAFFAFKYGYLKPREEKAQAQITLGLSYISQADYQKALNGDGKFLGYKRIADDFSFTDAANIAKAYAGICYKNLNNPKMAIKYLEDYSVKDDHSISPAVLSCLANCYEDDKQPEKAVETFKKAADDASNSAMSPMYLLEAGKILESINQKEKALKIYKEIKSQYPDAPICAPNQSQNGAIENAEIDKYIERVSK